MIPPVSPYGLIQETLWPDEWMIIVAGIMLNCTTRKQVEQVLPEFRRCWPTPQSFVTASYVDVFGVIKPLGFGNRRTDNLLKMTRAYLTTDWHHASELPGVGAYGARSWEIFCQGVVGTEPPKDHALLQYWGWAISLACRQRADDLVVLEEAAQGVVAGEQRDVRHVLLEAVGCADELPRGVESRPARVAEVDRG